MLYPWLFILPVVAVAMIISYCLTIHNAKKRKKTKQTNTLISHTSSIRNLDAYKKAQKSYSLLITIGAILLFGTLISATIVASRPITLNLVNTEYSNRDISLCLDVSGSMSKDLKSMIERLTEIVSEMKGERFSITIFDGVPITILPFTDDYNTATETLKSIQTDFSIYSNGATESSLGTSMIGPGLVGCVQSFDKLNDAERSRSIILYTDNYYSKTQPISLLQAAKFAKYNGIILYGINTADYSISDTPTSRSKEAQEFYSAVTLTGGSYYSTNAKDSNPTEIINQIMEQQAALVEGADKYIKNDTPMIPVIITTILGALYMITVWRLRL